MGINHENWHAPVRYLLRRTVRARRENKKRLVSVHRATVSDGECLDHQDVILNNAENTIAAHAVPPLTGAIGGEPFAMDARIITSFEILAYPGNDKQGIESVHLLELFQCRL